jgi:hypothetical protein
MGADEETQEKKMELLKWLDHLGNKSSRKEYTDNFTINSGNQYYGLVPVVNPRTESAFGGGKVATTNVTSRYYGANGSSRNPNDIPMYKFNSCGEIPMISIDEWYNEIREKEFDAFVITGGDYGTALHIEKVKAKRNEVYPIPYYNAKITKAIREKYGSCPRTIFVKIDGSYINYTGHDIRIQSEGTTYVSDTYVSENHIDSMIKRNIAFESNGTFFFTNSRFAIITGVDTVSYHSTYDTSVPKEMFRVNPGYGHKLNLLINPVREEYVFFADDDVAQGHGFVYCDSSGNQRPIGIAVQHANAVYHRMFKNFGTQWKCPKDSDFTIGFEIEKEDEDMINEHKYRALFNKTRWIKESDGSLHDEWGYELVSPVFNLMDNSLEKDLEDNPELKDLINGDYNAVIVDEDNEDDDHCDGYHIGDTVESCGGHINLGSSIYSPIQLFFGLKGFLPLLYSVYNLRVDKHYSKAYKTYNYLNDNENRRNNHSTALQIKENVLEFRIVAAVRNVKNLMWRRDLFRIMVSNINKSEREVLRMMLNPRSILHRHLRKVYKSDKRFMKKCNDFVKFSDMYNSVKLNPIDWAAVKSVNTDDDTPSNGEEG